MRASVPRFGATVLAGLAVFASVGTPAHAQRYPVTGTVPTPRYVNPYTLMPNGMTIGQYAHNTAVLGNAFAQVPPYLLGAAPFAGAIDPGVAALAAGGGYGLGPYASLAATGYGAGLGPYASLATTGYGGAPGGYGGYPGYGYGWAGYGYQMNASFANPFYGYLSGVADVTTANAKYWKTIQEGRLLREQSYRSALETRRKIIEEADWERGEWLKRIDPETNRQREQEVALDRARHDPPLTEILSARALNDLLRHLAKQQGKGEKGPNVPLDQDMLRGINVTGQDTRANVGLLKDDGKLQWPLPLQGSEFADGRERMDKLIADAVNVVKFNNPVEPGKLKDLRAELGRLNAALLNDINEMSPSQYIEAKRYLNLLEDAVRALEDPKVSNYFNGSWAAKSKNVAELVKYMSERGLRFAPAVPGDADAYRALYHALQAFDAGMTAVASSSHRE